MRIINIDKALELPQEMKVLHEALEDLYAKQQEEFQKSNPLKEIYQVVPLDRFQKSFGSSTGFKKAFEKTVDYAAYPGFANGDGFKTTVSYTPFSGKVVVSWQTILEGDYAGITQTLKDFKTAWDRQIVELGMFALTGMFGKKVFDPVSKNWIKIDAADTVDGDPMNPVKNPVFTNKHNIVRRDDMTEAEFAKGVQANKFFIDVKLDGTDPLAYAKLANGLYQVKVRMNKYLDDNGQRAGLRGRKKIVATEDAQLNSAIESILAADNFTYATGKPSLNQVKDGFDRYFTPYLDGTEEQPIPQFATGEDGIAKGLLILDPEYNKANHGPMMVERYGYQMRAVKTDEPRGIKYLADQAFEFFCPSWRGIVYVYIGRPNGAKGEWNDIDTFVEIKPVVFANAVQVVGTVETKAATQDNA